RALRHEDGKKILLRVDPEEGAGHAAPEVLAGRAEEGGDAGLSADAKTEAKAVTRGEQRAADLDGGVEMIGGHQFQRLAADDPLAVERAAAEQHLAEARIIHCGGNEPAAA